MLRVAETFDPVLGRRVVSAAVLAAAALGALAVGGWAFGALVVLALAALASEWTALGERLWCRRTAVVAGTAAFGVPVLAVVAALAGFAGHGLVLLAAGAALAALTATVLGASAPWAALGVAYLGLPALALVWLRAEPPSGLALVLWLFAVVWATDIVAYAVGRGVGGPRLAPRISPGKTWSGLGGGVVAAALVGAIGAALIPGASPGVARALVVAGLLGAGLAVVSQLGDLWESFLKRRAGIKDTGGLIPGHGGAFDRLDSLLAAAPAWALVVLLRGREVLPWQ